MMFTKFFYYYIAIMLTLIVLGSCALLEAANPDAYIGNAAEAIITDLADMPDTYGTDDQVLKYDNDTGRFYFADDVDTDTDTNTNAGTICADGEFLNGDGTCDTVVVDTDDQTIDVLSLAGTTLSISLEDDGEANQTVDLAGLQDGYEADTVLSEAQVDAYADNNGYLTSESDPTVDLSLLQSLTTNDFHNLGGTDLVLTELQVDAYADDNGYLETESDPVYGAWDKSTGISITESQVSDLDHSDTRFQTLTTAEVDQLELIGETTITAEAWGYLGTMDQDVDTTADVTFDEITFGSLIKAGSRAGTPGYGFDMYNQADPDTASLGKGINAVYVHSPASPTGSNYVGIFGYNILGGSNYGIASPLNTSEVYGLDFANIALAVLWGGIGDGGSAYVDLFGVRAVNVGSGATLTARNVFGLNVQVAEGSLYAYGNAKGVFIKADSLNSPGAILGNLSLLEIEKPLGTYVTGYSRQVNLLGNGNNSGIWFDGAERLYSDGSFLRSSAAFASDDGLVVNEPDASSTALTVTGGNTGAILASFYRTDGSSDGGVTIRSLAGDPTIAFDTEGGETFWYAGVDDNDDDSFNIGIAASAYNAYPSGGTNLMKVNAEGKVFLNYGLDVAGTIESNFTIDTNLLVVPTATADVTYDDLDVTGVNYVQIYTSTYNVTIGGLVGGVTGQKIHIYQTSPGGSLIVESLEGGGDQDIVTTTGVDKTFVQYGGITLFYNGTRWYELGGE